MMIEKTGGEIWSRNSSTIGIQSDGSSPLCSRIWLRKHYELYLALTFPTTLSEDLFSGRGSTN